MSTTFYRYIFQLLWLFSLTQVSVAQQFDVTRFRQLPHDLSASVSPVTDLNGYGCALVKVVGSSAFAFSSPLGIVKREDHTGEIWLYLPKGSRRITLKHPRWGVWRDYQFTFPLKEKCTYELVIKQPIEPSSLPPLGKPIGIQVEYSLDEWLEAPSNTTLCIPVLPWRPIGMVVCGVTNWNQPTIGMRIGVLRQHGFYLSIQSDLHTIPSTDGDCNRYGIPPGQALAPYDTGKKRYGRYTLMAGAMHPILPNLYIHEAFGYGNHTVAWEKVNGTWLRNTYYSANGWCAEAGFIFRPNKNRWIVSTSIQTITATYWEGTIGVGYVL